MNYLSVENLRKSFNERVLFDDVTFGVDQGQKVALVGANGCGKSTLLKIIMGYEASDSGITTFRNGIEVSFLEQNPVFKEDDTVFQAIFDSPNEQLQLIRDYEYHVARAETHAASQEALIDIMGRLDALNAWDYEAQVKQILGQLGLYDAEQKVNTLSGGQRKRVALARTLIERPDFLILDEPTNHLDLDVIEWLEEYLAVTNMSLLLVTHDRYFLEKVTNQIVEVDGGKAYTYQGAYSKFLEAKTNRMEQARTEVAKAQNLMRKELDWVRRQPKARGTKAKYRLDAFEDLKTVAGKRVEEKEVVLDVKGRRQGKKVMELVHLIKAFGTKKIVDDFSYVFKRSDKIGIVGPNGAGKSTFLQMLTGALEPDGGKVIQGQNTHFGFYTQEDFPFKDDQRVLEVVQDVAEFIDLSDGNSISASQLLNRFLFPPKTQHSMVGKLSGGEKRRLQLLRVLMSNPNFLILDEPTNDLDLMTLNVLEEFLEHFHGTLVVVSHDRYFMDRLVEHLFVFEGNGHMRDFPGNYTDYRNWAVEEKRKAAAAKEKSPEVVKAKPKSKEKDSTPKKRRLSFKERQEFEALGEEIERLEGSKTELMDKMNAGSGTHEELTAWAKELEVLSEQLEEKEMRWLELSEWAE